MDDHRPGYRRGWPDEQRHKVLLDPRDSASVRLFCARVIVEDADGRDRVVRRIDHIVGHETFDIADDRNGAFLDPACQLFGHSSLCLTLADSGVHGIILPLPVAASRPASAGIMHDAGSPWAG